jgi:oxygen-independent coproporphyrinogen-3 oxidase
VLGLYVHIPFCAAICGYCNFNRGLFDAALKARYLDALVAEIARAASGRPADTIFFGGGTPSLLDAADVHRVIESCRRAFRVASDAEITLEANPETVTADRLASFRDAGVTRLSLGVQSLDDRELTRLDRLHSAAKAESAFRAARHAGFDDISLDLMFWLPGQTLDSWARTLDRALALGPDHLSFYLLELYPNTPLKEAMARGRSGGAGEAGAPAAWAQASDDEAADMYLMALDRVGAAGLEQYEISNVAVPGHASRHNVKYWQEGHWAGFGCGAHSTVDALRWHNVASTTEYIDRVGRGASPRAAEEQLAPESRLQEALFTGLRLTAGIDRDQFRSRHGVDPLVLHAGVFEGLPEGLVWADGRRFGLTRRGMLLANEILQAFV